EGAAILARSFRAMKFVRRQRAAAERIEIDQQPNHHADAGSAEAVVPADLLAERAADERGQERPEIDPDIEDRVGAVTPRIAVLIRSEEHTSELQSHSDI